MAGRAQLVEGAAGRRQGALRTCCLTRVEYTPDELIRFVADPEGNIVPDLARRLPGRGVWVVAGRAAVAEAARKNSFSKGLRRQVRVPGDLADQVDLLLRKRLVALLSLANKAGLVTTGFTRVDKAVTKGSAVALVHAEDASEEGAGRLDRKFLAMAREAGESAPVIRLLTVEELSLALGGSNVVHAALSAGGATSKFLNEASRVVRFRSDASGSGGGHSARAASRRGDSRERTEV